jgi:ABC-type multidrug transport system fused ATPase/permease subunit
LSNFWDLILLIASTFIFIAYLLVLFQIIVDLFRDPDLGGGSKVLWIIGLIFVPVLTSLIYILTRGRGMAARQRSEVQRARSDAESYIREVAGKSPADQIADAKRLLDAGTINADEFARLKAKALG